MGISLTGNSADRNGTFIFQGIVDRKMILTLPWGNADREVGIYPCLRTLQRENIPFGVKKTGKGEMTVCGNCASRKVGEKLFLGIMQAGRGGTSLSRDSEDKVRNIPF
jgi:hypothetical protein